jgi:5'-3' exonuclease
MSTLEEWTAAVCADLGLDPGSADTRTVLDLARDVAHGVARPAAPLTAYLVGVAVGRGLSLPDAAARVQALAASWAAASAENRDLPDSYESRHRPAVCTHVGCILGAALGPEGVVRPTTLQPGRGWQDGGVGSLMLLDTASLYFRAFYGVPDTVRAPDGTPVNAVRGLLDMIARLVRARQPARLVACLDADWRPAFRVAAIPSYKAHRLAEEGREQTPPALDAQVPVIEEVLTASGLAVAGHPGFEADDVIATLAARSADPVDVVTGDRDLFQVVDDARGVRVIYTVRGLLNIDVIDEAAVTAKYGIPGRAYADFAALRGDPSDGLPGVPGVGEKTAAALIRTFGSIEGIIAALDAGHGGFPRGSRDKLEKARDYLAVALSVVRVVDDVPLPEVEGNLPAVPADAVRLKNLGERWGLGSSLSRFLTAVASQS